MSASPAKAAKTTAVAKRPPSGVALQSIDDLSRLAEILFKSGQAKGHARWESVFATVLTGLELGLSPTQSIRCIHTGAGRAEIWGDAIPGLAIASGLVDGQPVEREVGTPNADDWGWEVTVKRKGYANPHTVRFTVADACKAELWGKKGPWQTNPRRMLLWRARNFCYRDLFPDVYFGLDVGGDEPTAAAIDSPTTVEVVSVRNASPEPHANGVARPELAPPAAASAAAAEASAEPTDGPIGEDQLSKIAQHRAEYLRILGVDVTNKDAVGKAWSSVLATWNVTSAKQLTHRQADELLNEMLKHCHAHDPLAQRLARP